MTTKIGKEAMEHETEKHHEGSTHHTKKSLLQNRKLIVGVSAILILTVVTIPSYYFYSKYQHTRHLLENPTAITAEETQQILGRVGKLIRLPQGETPTIATVSDKEKLKDQPFFANAKNGDKVLIFTNARKAILYDPVANVIVDTAPINVGSPSASTPQPTSAEIRVTLLNGTNITGLTLKTEKPLKDKFPTITVSGRDNAKRKDYKENLVIDLTGSRAQEALSIASFVKGKISSLPAGEATPPDTDILIILGEEKTE